MLNNHSTGPRTDAGKQTSSRNAVKHGCCSNETLILATENIEDFKALESVWFQSYSPKDDLEAHLLNQIVQADWFLQRATRTLAGVEAQFYSEVPTPSDMYDCHHVALQRFMRYQTTRRNEFTKAKKVLDDHRKIQASEKRAAEKQAMEKEKAEAYKKKNKSQLSFIELVQATRDEAIEKGLLDPSIGRDVIPKSPK
jgi:hypothetical protein